MNTLAAIAWGLAFAILVCTVNLCIISTIMGRRGRARMIDHLSIHDRVLREWPRIPLRLRQRYWRETDYGARAPSFELLIAMEAGLGREPPSQGVGVSPVRESLDPPPKKEGV